MWKYGRDEAFQKTGTLVVISDDTKKLYQDIWKNGVLYYTGMGKKGIK